MRLRVALLVFVPAVLAGGCADLMAAKQQAPAWFEAAQREIAGEGYPELCDVPESQTPTQTAAQWEGEAASLRTAATAIETEVAGRDPLPTEEETRATEALLRARAEGRAP